MDPALFLFEEYLRTAFDILDKDNNGLIDGDQVNALLAGEELEDYVSKEAVAAAMAEIDTNGDGVIDFNEFVAMMKSASKHHA